MRSKRRIIPAVQAAALPPASFRPFERRPVNYFRSMITTDEEQAEVQRPSDDEVHARVAAAVNAERARQERIAQQEAQRQFQAGLAQGRSEAGGEVQRTVELLAQHVRLLQAEKHEVADRCEQSSVDLAFQIARRIIGQELELKPENVTAVVRGALEQVLDCDRVRLRVHPADFSHLRTVEEELKATLGASVQFELRSDNEVERGGCLIETEKGTLDARIASQLETLWAEVSRQTPASEGAAQ
jgi:flagellar assembly protein FliH